MDCSELFFCSSDKGLTQLCRDYIVNFTITNKKTAPVVKAFKRVIVENFAKGISRDTLLRVADTFCTRAKLCIQEKGWPFEYLSKQKSEPNDVTKRLYL